MGDTTYQFKAISPPAFLLHYECQEAQSELSTFLGASGYVSLLSPLAAGIKSR
jgi:hypothetical protein